jgi:hypothetical protein
VWFRRGVSGGAVARSVAASRPTPPDYPPAVLMVSQIYAGFSCVGGPDSEDAPCQFIPLYPFLGRGMLWVVLPHQVIGWDQRHIPKREKAGKSNNWMKSSRNRLQRCGGEFGREAKVTDESNRVWLVAYRARMEKKRGGDAVIHAPCRLSPYAVSCVPVPH